MSEQMPKKGRSKKAIITGSAILIVGIIWLLRKAGVYIPHYLFGWEMILILIGLAIGIDNKFRNPASYVLIAIGSIFLIDDVFDIPFHVMEYFWPLLVIFIGLMVLIRPNRRSSVTGAESGGPFDKLDLVSIFNGTKRNVQTKQFKGGETVTIFGGTELNLLQADMEEPVVLETTTIFGGTKLIVPRDWEVRTEATAIFGGVEDKRVSAVEVVSQERVLIITGTVIFGGVDIVSY